MSKGITMSIIFQAQSLNYGEGTANISELKKFSRGDGNQYTFASRQCLRYDIARLGQEFFGWNLQVVDKSKGTLQFKDEYTIRDSEEMDLFGYMKTVKSEGSNVRPAVVRISHAVSLEPYNNDIELLTNKGFADRINEDVNMANIEQHLSYYTYTITIDLDKVGKDGDIELDNLKKFERISQLLDIIKVLNRNIRGRQENLSPKFIIGGTYSFPIPFFHGRIKLDLEKGKDYIDIRPIRDTVNMKIFDNDILSNTYVGIVNGIFKNQDEFKEIFKNRLISVEEFFEIMKENVKKYFGV